MKYYFWICKNNLRDFLFCSSALISLLILTNTFLLKNWYGFPFAMIFYFCVWIRDIRKQAENVDNKIWYAIEKKVKKWKKLYPFKNNHEFVDIAIKSDKFKDFSFSFKNQWQDLNFVFYDKEKNKQILSPVLTKNDRAIEFFQAFIQDNGEERLKNIYLQNQLKQERAKNTLMLKEIEVQKAKLAILNTIEKPLEKDLLLRSSTAPNNTLVRPASYTQTESELLVCPSSQE
jgi:hypothetical protein